MERNGQVCINDVECCMTEFDSIDNKAFASLIRERETTDNLSKIMVLAQKENDFLAQEFLLGMLKEQVEEEDKSQTLVDRVNNANGDVAALFAIDSLYGG